MWTHIFSRLEIKVDMKTLKFDEVGVQQIENISNAGWVKTTVFRIVQFMLHVKAQRLTVQGV